MKAVILVGGEGTRLRPLTWNKPKAIVPILNRPFLEHLIRYLKKHGIDEIILAMGYLPDPIKACLGDGSQLGVKVRYVVEDSPMGTAGAVKNAESYLDGPFIVFNGDIVTEVDLTDMIKRHQEASPGVSMALTPVDNPTIYGVVETDARGLVRRFVEKPGWDQVTTNMINAGIYILEPEILARIPSSRRCMFEHDIFPSLLENGEPIIGYPSDAYWIDIGTPGKYLKAHHDLLANQGNLRVQTEDEGQSKIHPSAKIIGQVLIAEGCVIAEDASIIGPAVIGPGCKIDKGAIVEGAVLWDEVKVGRAAELKDCIIGSGSDIQEGCNISSGCVLGDKVRVESRLRLTSSTRVDPDTCLS